MSVCGVVVVLLWCVMFTVDVHLLLLFIVVVVVVGVVEWLFYSKRIIICRWADLSDFFR